MFIDNLDEDYKKIEQQIKDILVEKYGYSEERSRTDEIVTLQILNIFAKREGMILKEYKEMFDEFKREMNAEIIKAMM